MKRPAPERNTLHERRFTHRRCFTRKSSGSAIAAEVFMSHVGWGKVAMACRGVRGKATTPSVFPFIVGLLKSYISFRDTTVEAPAWERCRSSELPLVEGANGRVYAVSVSCGNDRPHAGRGAGLVLTSHGAYARRPLLRGRTRMDHQRDSGWIEPLEATALSADEETDTQTPVPVEGDMI